MPPNVSRRMIPVLGFCHRQGVERQNAGFEAVLLLRFTKFLDLLMNSALRYS